MSNPRSLRDLRYAPDIEIFDLEGSAGIVNTLISFVVGPVRLVLRVTHNIMTLPAPMLYSFANSLLLVSTIFGAIGLLDFLVYKKWPLLVSQVISALVAILIRQKTAASVDFDEIVREVEIDNEQVEELVGSLYDRIDTKVEDLTNE